MCPFPALSIMVTTDVRVTVHSMATTGTSVSQWRVVLVAREMMKDVSRPLDNLVNVYVSRVSLRMADIDPTLKRRLSSIGSAENLLLHLVPMRNSTAMTSYRALPLTERAKTRSVYIVTDTTKTIRHVALWCP